MLNEGGGELRVPGRDYLTTQTSKHLRAFLKIDLQENFSALKILSSQKRGGSRGVPFEPFGLPTPSLMFFLNT
jgi:hypothetical protein